MSPFGRVFRKVYVPLQGDWVVFPDFFVSKVDGYGFQRPEDFDFKTYEEFMSSYMTVLARRAARWKGYLGQKDKVTKSGKVKRFCRKGVPSSSRPMVWMHVSGAARRMAENPDMYTKMLGAQHDPELIETINMDLHRTFPDNLYFTVEGGSSSLRKPLYNVLVAVAHKNTRTGYCQGMNYVAALLLLIMKKEEKVFWLMDTLINDLLPDFYSPDMKAVKIEQEVLGELIKWKCPEVHAHIERLGVHWCLIGMKWFICLFADVMPIETVLRVWDCLFYEGSKILLRAAVTLIIANKEKIAKCQNFSEAVDVLKNMVQDPQIVNCHTFLNKMFTELGPFPRSRINKLREECASRV